MAEIRVTGSNLHFQGRNYRCAVGKGGFSAGKREGDGCTPLGRFGLRECLWRQDRLKAPKTRLLVFPIHEDDGWCDDAASPMYNRPVKLPYDFTHERLWREDHVYDVIVPIGYNDEPVAAGKGSAIFLHVAHEDYSPTEGCVALALPDLLAVLEMCDSDTFIAIDAG